MGMLSLGWVVGTFPRTFSWECPPLIRLILAVSFLGTEFCGDHGPNF